MAQRKRATANSVKFEFSDDEIKVLVRMCKIADEHVGMYGLARRFEAFFINAKAMGNGQVVEQQLLTNPSEIDL